jgi:hypothetical protein
MQHGEYIAIHMRHPSDGQACAIILRDLSNEPRALQGTYIYRKAEKAFVNPQDPCDSYSTREVARWKPATLRINL